MNGYESEISHLETRMGKPRKERPDRDAFEKAAQIIRQIREGDGSGDEAIGCAVFHTGIRPGTALGLLRVFSGQFDWVGEAIEQSVRQNCNSVEIDINSPPESAKDRSAFSDLIEPHLLSKQELAMLSRSEHPHVAKIASRFLNREG